MTEKEIAKKLAEIRRQGQGVKNHPEFKVVHTGGTEGHGPQFFGDRKPITPEVAARWNIVVKP